MSLIFYIMHCANLPVDQHRKVYPNKGHDTYLLIFLLIICQECITMSKTSLETFSNNKFTVEDRIDGTTATLNVSHRVLRLIAVIR
jgi:hypothetical protein